MNSLSPTRTEPPSAAGRSVRDIVDTSPELVNEVWCRKIFRQILQSLELQYAMRMPHRAITPDTVVFQENGEPLLVPAQVGEPAHTEAEDLYALAAIVHYAITRETVLTGPLRGRAPEGYSDSLIAAVDRSLSPDPAERPRTIDELRNILGIVSLGPPTGAQLAAASGVSPVRAPMPGGAADAGLPSFAQDAARGARGAGLGRWQRWAIAGGGAALLAALALTMFAELRDSGSYDHIVLTLPQDGGHAGDGKNNSSGTGRNGTMLAGAPTPAQDPASTAVGASSGGATASGGQDSLAAAAQYQDNAALPGAIRTAHPDASPNTSPAAGMPPPAPARRPAPARAEASAVPNGGASYRLRIQPWGVVYVDGVDRGVSPPVKRLALAPGRHTLRVTNPAFPDRVLEVDTGGGDGVVAVDFNDQGK